MSETPRYIVIYCAYPDEKTSDEASRALVTKKIASCVQRIGPIQSTYMWKGAVNTAQEWLLLIKTKMSAYENVATFIQTTHPYEVPEILAVPVVRGFQPYLSWMDQGISDSPAF